MGAQLQSLMRTTAPKIFLKIYFPYDFGVHELVRSEPFLDYPCKICQLLSALYSNVCKKIYIRAYLRSRS